MPSLAQHESTGVVKALCLGNSGTGKTGAMASLVDAGLKLRVLDFDNGLGPLAGFAKRKDLLASNVHFVTLRDKLQLRGARIGVQKADAFARAMDALDGGPKAAKLWGSEEEPMDFGPVTSWGPDVVLAVDTLALAGKSALQHVMGISPGKTPGQPELQHYGVGMDNIEKLLDILTSPAVGCHVIVNTHTATPEGQTIPVPEALGSKLGPKVPKFFDNMFSISLSGSKRSIKTKRDGLVALKSAKQLADEYPIETGWADIFKELTGKKELV
jgi:hypothetical protein